MLSNDTEFRTVGLFLDPTNFILNKTRCKCFKNGSCLYSSFQIQSAQGQVAASLPPEEEELGCRSCRAQRCQCRVGREAYNLLLRIPELSFSRLVERREGIPKISSSSKVGLLQSKRDLVPNW